MVYVDVETLRWPVYTAYQLLYYQYSWLDSLTIYMNCLNGGNCPPDCLDGQFSRLDYLFHFLDSRLRCRLAGYTVRSIEVYIHLTTYTVSLSG